MAGGGFRDYLVPRPVTFRTTAMVPEAPRRGHAVRLGVIIGAVGIQVFFFLATIIPGQQILPGDWTTLGPSFLVDILYSTLALAILAALPLVNPARAAALVIEPGGFAGFTTRFFVFGVIWTIIGIGLGLMGGAQIPALSDVERLQGLVEFVVFVSVSEELFFRCALTEMFGGVLSTAAFAAYHMFAYSVTAGVGWGLLLAMAEAALYGVVFLWEYKAFGLSAAIASHAAIDLATSGVISSTGHHAFGGLGAF